MCLAIPARVVELRPGSAVVQRYGERLTVSLQLMEEPVAVGDHLIVQAQAYAVCKIDADEAREAYRVFDEILCALAEKPPAGGH
jgi:hydrogenase expression/formation protein HypC